MTARHSLHTCLRATASVPSCMVPYVSEAVAGDDGSRQPLFRGEDGGSTDYHCCIYIIMMVVIAGSEECTGGAGSRRGRVYVYLRAERRGGYGLCGGPYAGL